MCIRDSHYTDLRYLLGDTGGVDGEAESVREGILFVLRTTYIAGNRYMGQQMHDIIPVSDITGHRHIFVTMKLNPNWPEISRTLFPGPTSKDGPHIFRRVLKTNL